MTQHHADNRIAVLAKDHEGKTVIAEFHISAKDLLELLKNSPVGTPIWEPYHATASRVWGKGPLTFEKPLLTNEEVFLKVEELLRLYNEMDGRFVQIPDTLAIPV